jgi:hypothetical protein
MTVFAVIFRSGERPRLVKSVCNRVEAFKPVGEFMGD